MDKDNFKVRLERATRALIEFTNNVSTIPLSDNVRYLIVPNVHTPDAHLTDFEVGRLSIMNRFEGKQLKAEKVMDLICVNDTVPLWINMSVCQATTDVTIIELLCSRRFRSDDQLNHRVSEFPPFSITVPIEPKTTVLPEYNNFYSYFSSISKSTIKDAMLDSGWSCRKASWTDYELVNDWSDLTLEGKEASPILFGRVAFHTTPVEQLDRFLEKLDGRFRYEFYNQDKTVLLEKKQQ